MSEAVIATLNKRVEELTAQVTTLNAEGKTRRIQGKKLATELEATKGQVAGLTKERDDWQAKAKAAPSDLQAQLDAATSKLAQRDHTDAFSAALAAFTVKGEDGTEVEHTLNQGAKLEHVWQAIGYKAEGQAPDGPTAAKLMGEALKAQPFLFAPKTGGDPKDAAGAAKTAVTTPATPPGPGAGRSAATTTSSALSARAQIDAGYAAVGGKAPGRIA